MRRRQGWWTCPLHLCGCRHLGSTSTQSSCNLYLIEIPPGRNAKPRAEYSGCMITHRGGHSMKMRLMFLVFLLLVVSFDLGLARQTQQGSNSCGFLVQGEPAHPTVTGPDDIVPLVYVVEQPDSPIEVVSVDLTGMWLSVANEQTTVKDCAKYQIRNRSD